MEYEVRGRVVLEADKINQQLSVKPHKSYDHIIYTNIGNPQVSDPDVEGHLYKLASSSLCPNVDGQVMTRCDEILKLAT